MTLLGTFRTMEESSRLKTAYYPKDDDCLIDRRKKSKKALKSFLPSPCDVCAISCGVCSIFCDVYAIILWCIFENLVMYILYLVMYNLCIVMYIRTSCDVYSIILQCMCIYCMFMLHGVLWKKGQLFIGQK